MFLGPFESCSRAERSYVAGCVTENILLESLLAQSLILNKVGRLIFGIEKNGNNRKLRYFINRSFVICTCPLVFSTKSINS
jgi:hypothetical protein